MGLFWEDAKHRFFLCIIDATYFIRNDIGIPIEAYKVIGLQWCVTIFKTLTLLKFPKIGRGTYLHALRNSNIKIRFSVNF